MDENRRAYLRYPIRRAGKLLFVDRPCLVDCTIRNISEDGALLCLAASTVLPSVLLLWEQPTGAMHECEVKWRDGRILGVRFTDACGRKRRQAAMEMHFSSLGYLPGGRFLRH